MYSMSDIGRLVEIKHKETDEKHFGWVEDITDCGSLIVRAEHSACMYFDSHELLIDARYDTEWKIMKVGKVRYEEYDEPRRIRSIRA